MPRLKVLLVDDNRDLADGLAEALRDAGHDVAIAYTGGEAISLFRKNQYTLTLMDVQLPDMSGWVASREIRRRDPEVKVVMLTGLQVEQLLNLLSPSGCAEVLRAGCSMDEVLNTVGRAERGGIVLVLESDPNFPPKLVSLLLNRELDVARVQTSEEALEVREGDCDVLVLDLRLPVMQVLETYLDLGRYAENWLTVIVSGHCRQDEEGIDLMRDVSVTGCLIKPFDPAAVLEGLGDWALGRGRCRD